MDSVLAFCLMVFMIIVVGAFYYKYRAVVQRWLHDPKYGTSWTPDRKVILQRHIEDAKAEMEWLDEKAEDKKLKETKSIY